MSDVEIEKTEVKISKVRSKKEEDDKVSWYTIETTAFKEGDYFFEPPVTREWIAEFNALPQKSPNVYVEFTTARLGSFRIETLRDLAHEALCDSPDGTIFYIDGVGKLKVRCTDADLKYRENSEGKIEAYIWIRAKVVYASLEGLYHDEDRKLVGLVCKRCGEPLDSLAKGKSGCKKCGMTYMVHVQEENRAPETEKNATA